MNILPSSTYQARLSQSGQALLIVVLSLAVVLTIVLSILARSVTDIKISTGGEEALRAFSAAEAGIERALIAGSGSISCNALSCPEYGGAEFSAAVTKVGKDSTFFVNPTPLLSGESSLFWFVAHDENGNLVCETGNDCFTGDQVKVCWGKEGTSGSIAETPAIELSVVYAVTPNDYSSLQVAREAVDPNSSRRLLNSFSAPDSVSSCTIGTENYAFQKTLTFSALNILSYDEPGGLQFLLTRLIYNEGVSHGVGISVASFPGNGLLPAQGTVVDSSGNFGEANRKINVFQGFGEVPLPFGTVLFSPTGITK